jgi:hypothetical protein
LEFIPEGEAALCNRRVELAVVRVEDDEDRVWGILAEVKLANGSVKVEQGDFDSKNMRQSIPFNGSTKIGNAKVLDAFIHIVIDYIIYVFLNEVYKTYKKLRLQ